MYEQKGLCIDLEMLPLGTGGASKTDELFEKFQTALDPPLIFGKSDCNLFSISCPV